MEYDTSNRICNTDNFNPGWEECNELKNAYVILLFYEHAQ
jgi:hypothetical protein